MIIKTTPTSITAVFAACIAIALGVDAAVATAASASPVTASQASPAPTDTVSATEGAQFSGQVAVITAQCASPQDPQATISWSDGGPTSAAGVSVSGLQLSLSGSNVYREEGSFSGTVSGSYTCPNPMALPRVNFTARFAATVADAPITITQGPVLPAGMVAGHSFTAQVAQFTDADPAGAAGDYAATVSWGDGTTSTGTVAPAGNGFAITATHSYPTAGSYMPEVRIDDQGGASVTAEGVVQVAPAAASAGVRVALARLVTRVEPHVGNGTTVLSLNPTQPGVLTIFPVRRHHRLLVAGRTIHVSKAGAVVVVLQPTAAARLLLHDKALSAKVKIKFNPLMGPSITEWAAIGIDYLVYCGSMTYYYTGAEQSCIVPNGVHAVSVKAVGGHGGDVSQPCPPGCWYGDYGGVGGRGALVVSPEVFVHPGQTLYIEVGGNGGDINGPGSGLGGFSTGDPTGGWNGGGGGQVPASGAASAGGGGASDVQTLSCAQLCDQLGFRYVPALDTRLVVAGGGGGGGSGGFMDSNTDATKGGSGGDAGAQEWGGWPGGAASSTAFALLGGGGGGGDPYTGPGGGGESVYYSGANGMFGAGGAGGNDTESEYHSGVYLQGYAGGGGGGGYYGGGGGGGGLFSQADTVGGGGGGGGGSSYGPAGTSVQINVSGSQPYVQVTPLP